MNLSSHLNDNWEICSQFRLLSTLKCPLSSWKSCLGTIVPSAVSWYKLIYSCALTVPNWFIWSPCYFSNSDGGTRYFVLIILILSHHVYCVTTLICSNFLYCFKQNRVYYFRKILHDRGLNLKIILLSAVSSWDLATWQSHFCFFNLGK